MINGITDVSGSLDLQLLNVLMDHGSPFLKKARFLYKVSNFKYILVSYVI